MEVFPNLFKLETVKNCSVKDRLSGMWLWKHDHELDDEVFELVALNSEVAAVSLRDSKDDWKWLPDRSGMFSVRSVRKLLVAAEVDVNRSVIDWCSWVPIKCNVFVWRVGLNRIPTADALLRRGIHVGEGVCPLCKSGDESVEHLFTSCVVAIILWQKVSRWCGLPPIFAFSVFDLLETHKDRNISPGTKHVVQGVLFTSLWCLWLARNRAVFSNVDVKVDSVFSDVRSLGFLWYKHRRKGVVTSWSDWCKFVNL
ncbi:putative reverse transcriptase zinc-binding domain-containing protein [Helianthus annuus]|nr:putative reverse transcriptase zinc-binding domain-containing protein [Helianthus annuus]